MANEKRLIDGNALINLLKPLEKYSKVFEKIFRIIQTFTTVDAVEVVRCKECRHRLTRHNCQGRHPNFFCADGERKAEGK